MSLLDSNKVTTNSKIENQSQKCSKLNTIMDISSSSAEVTSPDHGTLGNIPVITASSPTSKCSTNDQMKTFDPGEDGGIERLTNNHCGNSLSPIKSGTSLLKNNNRNYKAGSKINKLADMLAKRSQNVVEVTENNSSDIITDFTCAPKVEDTVILNNSNNDADNDKSSNRPIDSFEKTVNGDGLDIYRKSRRKSVPNQSCNLNHLQLQSASKSCSDFSKLFPLEENGSPEFNALGGSLTNLQTDESTKKKAVRKNFKNIELSLILPEKKRRSSMRCESLVSSKIVEKIKGISSEAVLSIEGKDRNSERPRLIVASSEPSPASSARSTKVVKNKKPKQRKSKKLVETSTQTTEVEFNSVISPRIQNTDGKEGSGEGEKPPKVTNECLPSTQSLNLESQSEAHETTHSDKNTKPLIKCQFCSKKLSSLDELKSHCVQKHVDENQCCTNSGEGIPIIQESHSHEKESPLNANDDDNRQKKIADVDGEDGSQENKKDETETKSVEIKISKQNGAKADLKIDVSFESTKKSTISPKNVQKFSPKENRTEEQLLEMEMLFYSHLSGNIKENLANHLDGKIDKNGNPVRTDQITESTESTQAKSKSANLLSVVTPNVGGVPDAQVARAPSPYQTRSKTPNPLPPTAKKFKKLPNWQQKFWEKYNFPTNYRYEHRFWDKNYLNAEKSALYLKDLSCLDIKTQLTMRENIKKLEGIKSAEENSNPVEELKFPDYLSLVPRVSRERTHTETKTDSLGISDHSKGKKTMTKEKDECKQPFKPPDSELPGMKTRRKLSSDNSSLVKKSGPEKGNTDSVKMMTRRQSSIELIKEDKEEGSRKRKGSLDMSGGNQKMTLRRQSSLDNLQGSSGSKSEKNDQVLEGTSKSVTVESSPLSPTGSAEISGEWVRPRSYLCGTCCTKFTNLWELEDHKWVSHPNVWCTHYEFEDEKIDKLFQNNEDEANEVSSSEGSKELSKLKLTDLYKRYLLPHGSLKTAKLVPNTNFPEKCTKCKKHCMNSSEMHKHMLDCGGDTTWFLTMYSSPMTMKRRWRPFGSRRRKQLGRRDLKRNIPSTPSLRSYHYQHRIRTKPGDVESIQKMLANLPEKRARKAINFDEIKTRSQATIHSNRLLRKRLRSSFTNNFLKLKNLRQSQLRKDGSSKSASDASAESTPTGSPKRRNRLRENAQVVREESSKRNSRESSVEGGGGGKPAVTTATAKKKIVSSKKKVPGKHKNNKKAKSKESKDLRNASREKPATRSNTTVLIDSFEDFSKKTQLTRELALRIASETLSQRNDIQSNVKEPKEISKSGKKIKKKAKTDETSIRVRAEVSNTELSDPELSVKLTRKMKALKRKKLKDNKKKKHGSSSQDRSVLRLKHNGKDKTESLKETKQKFEDPKILVEERETKKVEFGSRRSLRLRSLPASDESLIIFDSFLDSASGLKKEENQKEPKGKKSVENSESVTSKKPVKASIGKSPNPKTSEPKVETKDIVILEENPGPVRRSSRSLRNSISSDDKPDVLTNGILETGTDVCRITRRLSRSISETLESDVAEDLVVPKKSPRLQNGRNVRQTEEKQESLLISKQTSLLRKTRFQTSVLPQVMVQSEDALSSSRKLDLSRNSDLSEMPILAKVEPIRSKLSGKNEKEIPILMPVVRERQEDVSKNDSPTKEEDLVSFEIIKKRRKTTKEVSPLKIIKKVENASWESQNPSGESFRVKETFSSSLVDISDTVKTRRRKMAERALAEMPSSREKETKNSNDVKKYFLGICPSEIDKGRNDPPDDSSSDSEPLITFVLNHSQRETVKSFAKKAGDSKEQDEVDSGKKEDAEITSEKVKRPKIKKKKKEKEKTKKLMVSSPVLMTTSNESQEQDVKPVSENDEKKDEELKLPEPAEVEKEPEIAVIEEEEKNETEDKTPKEDTCTVLSVKETTLEVVDKSSSSPDEIVLKTTFPEPKVDEEEISPPSEPKKDEEIPPPPEPEMDEKVIPPPSEPEKDEKDITPLLPEPKNAEEEIPPPSEPKKDEEEIPPLPEPKASNIFEENKETILPERRSRRISKEVKSSNEFIIDDPLILVDELWSDLDSDSDSSRKKSKKAKKKSSKKKNNEEKKTSDINLEELLRNFGENKENKEDKKEDEQVGSSASMTLRVVKRTSAKPNLSHKRNEIENRKKEKSYRRLSLTLFRFHKREWNFGNKGKRLSDVKKAIREEREETGRRASLPDLPFLATEIKENPVQVIQCRAQKSKTTKKGHKKSESKTLDGNIQLKISLPLESLHNMAVFNNNHLTELVIEDQPSQNRPEVFEETLQEDITKEPGNENPVDLLPEKDGHSSEEGQSISLEAAEENDLKNKTKRSEVIDKIFYCEICQTYYYSSSSLKTHKLSNRHKQKESEMLSKKEPPKEVEDTKVVEMEMNENDSHDVTVPTAENLDKPEKEVENIEADRLNEDTLEMPTLEGPFIENLPVRSEPKPVIPAPQPPLISSFGFCQESLKDVQRAIGCTDEEMLILTLLGENTIELENDILDLDSCKNSNQTKDVGSTTEKGEKESEKANGALSVDLKQRMTSALTCLVNKAVFNLLQKYENATKAGVNPEALSLLGRLSSLSRRKNISQLNDLLKKPSDGEPSIGTLSKEPEKREPTISYKYQCTICGSRFEKASTRECHISRSHKGKAKKLSEETRTGDDEWNDTWTYDTATNDHLGNTNTSQFWCSDCGINFLSPQEVLEHQKAEHQAGEKSVEKAKDAGPLQSSTIGSSDEIVEGKKTRRRTKLFSSEELDQQRIIANNELRKLDRKFTSKNKGNKIKWGMDALKFTVEKENKMVVVEEEKETAPPEEAEKVPVEAKNIDLVPKLNLTRTSNIPEFKVIQKNSLKNRFQKIIDNKLKRRSTRLSQQENETDEAETEVMLVPVVVKKKNKKQKMSRGGTKKGGESEKPLDVYDFNESESDDEPIIFSHLKKPGTSPTKLKLVKGKEGPSKNKADSTTKDLAPDDYDSEDSLPLSVMKKFKTGEEDEEKDEKTSEDGAEKSEGILEQVEYLIEQLENETGSSNKNESQELDKNEGGNLESKVDKVVEYSEEEVSKGEFVESRHQSVQPNVENEFLESQNAQDGFKNNEESVDVPTEEGPLEQEHGNLIEPESSQSTFDEEDSIPLVLMSKKAQLARAVEEKKFTDSADILDMSVTGIEDVRPYRAEEGKNYDEAANFPANPQPPIEDCLQSAFSPAENDADANEKLGKPFENVNGNVIYCRNDSLSDFGSDFSNDGLIDSNLDKFPTREINENFPKEVTENEDVVIMCSKGEEDSSSDDTEKKSQRRKKRFPLLTATIEENNFRKSESPKLNKEVIVRKIWSRKRFAEESTDNDDDSILSATANDSSLENIQNDASQTEVEKEIIVKKIWSRKKLDHEGEFTDKMDEKLDDVKINQTEISDEVIIKCGPKAKTSPKRRKSRSSTNESSKETIMRKIWSGKCTFQTKAALKNYDSDVITDSKENDISEEEPKPRKRGRPCSLSSVKRSKVEDDEDDDKDDLDSLLEEIEREELEKAIRLEFLQLRRSDKANVEILKEGSSPRMGLFKEATLRHRSERADRKRRKVRKNIKHPRQSTLLNRTKFRKKPIRRVVAIEERTVSEASSRTVSDPTTEQSETSIDKGNEAYDSDSKIRNRKHKKHRHKHHHHKHKHKKSKHHKYIVSKHKSKHKLEGVREGGGSLENADSFTILEKICQDIPNQIENEMQFRSRTPKMRLDSESTNLDDKMDDVLSSFSFDENNKTKDCDEPAIGFEDGFTGKETFATGNENNIYDFVEDVTDFDTDGNKKTQNVNY